jgi:S-(hydroxymethyl)glutathione dehydrogenase / alcohol dehydrogenase
MRAAILESYDQPLVIDDAVTLEAPRAGEVRVKVEHCGVCHSDVSGMDGSFPVPTPIILGHEAAGIVTEVGPDVTRIAEGDEVVLTPSPPCGHCYWCVRGQPGICASTTAMMHSFAMPDGTTRLRRGDEVVHRGLGVAAFAEEVIVSENGAIKVPPGVPLDRACLIGCGVQTGVGAVINTAQVEEGASVLVIGLGGVGMSVVQGARLAGASRIIVSDPLAARRDVAAKFGATDALDPTDTEVAVVVRDLTDGRGVDYAFEVVGRSALVASAIDSTRAGGTTVMVGAMPLTDDLTIEASVLFATSEKKLTGCFLGSSNSLRDVPRLLRLWQGGQLDLDGLVTAERPLDEVNEACDDLRAGRGIRTVLHC